MNEMEIFLLGIAWSLPSYAYLYIGIGFLFPTQAMHDPMVRDRLGQKSRLETIYHAII